MITFYFASFVCPPHCFGRFSFMYFFILSHVFKLFSKCILLHWRNNARYFLVLCWFLLFLFCYFCFLLMWTDIFLLYRWVWRRICSLVYLQHCGTLQIRYRTAALYRGAILFGLIFYFGLFIFSLCKPIFHSKQQAKIVKSHVLEPRRNTSEPTETDSLLPSSVRHRHRHRQRN